MDLQALVVALPVLLFSIVLHEYAHGWAALRQGDPTAKMLGRLTLNPVPHIDPVGSILVPAALILLVPGNAILGWAKPVPVDPRHFRDYRRGDIIVSLAGVAANALLILASVVVLVLVIWLARLIPGGLSAWQILAQMAYFGIFINAILIVFNLIPLPPLDGSRVVYHLLPPAMAYRYQSIAPMGIFILLFILLFVGFGFILAPVGVITGMAQAVVAFLT